MKDPEKILTKGTESALNNLPIDYGKLRFTTDTARIFLDLKDKRIEFTDIIRNYKEAEIKKIVAPLPKLYLSSDTHKLFYYENGWITISGGSSTSGGTTIDAYTKTETDTLLTDKVDKENGKGLLADTDKELYDDAVLKAHEHINESVLNKLGEDADGELEYNGKKITADLSTVYTKSETDALLDNKVDKEDGKGLLADTNKVDYDDAVLKAHEHSNESVLDKLEEDEDGELEYNGKKISADLSTVYTKTETDTLLDNKVDKEDGKGLLADTDKADYDDAVTKAHEHSNESVLDDLSDSNGILLYKGSIIGSGSDSGTTTGYTKTEADALLATKVDKEDGKGLLADTDKALYDDAALKAHEHTNETVLDKLSDNAGELEYDGKKISVDLSTVYTKTEADTLLDDKVNKEDGKSLLSDTDKALYDDAVTKVHEHSNSTVLDKLTDNNGELEYNGNKISIDLSTIYTKSETDALLDNKVDKEDGKGLLADTDKELYDDAALKAHEHTNSAILDKLEEDEDGELKYNGNKISADLSTVYTKTETDTLLDNKVDKEDGKSLLADEDKAKYDDAVLKAHEHSNESVLDKLKEDEDGELEYNGNKISIDLSTVYTKTETDALLDNKVDKEDGKALLADTDKELYDDAVTKAHEHSNESVLDKFNEDEDGNPTYNGNTISGGSSFSGNAIDVNYDNSTSGLSSIEVQSAIDELAAKYKDMDSSVTKIELGDVTDANVVESGMFSTKLTWTDPEDPVVAGAALAEWGGTRVVRKEGSIPTSATDGILVVDSKTRNQYKTNGFEDTGLTRGVKYYYRFFPYTEKQVYTNGTALSITLELIKTSDIPVQNAALTYNGKLQVANFDNFDTDKLTVSGNTGTNAGSYVASFTPKDGYCWSDGTTAAKDIAWDIEKADGTITLSATSIELSDTVPSSTITISDNTGDVSVTSENTSIVTATVTDNTITVSNVNNTDGTANITVNVAASQNYNAITKTISVNCKFTIKTSDVPVQNGTLTYNGSIQTASFDNFDTDKLTVSGNTGTDAGTYTATFTPKDGYCWSDGTTTGKTVTWVIDKADGAITLSATSIELSDTVPSSTITVSDNTGDVSVVSSNTSIATASVLNNIITISSVNNTKGTATITLTVASSQNYNAITETISVNCKFVNFITFADATDEEIAAMLEAHYNGTINIADYWSVGDMRTIHLDAMAATGVSESHVAQDQQFVIIGIEHDDLETPINNHTKAAITIQPLCVLSNGTSAEAGYMNSTNTNGGGWERCARRTWCNSVFVNALPLAIKNLIKTVSKLNYKVYKSTNLTTTSDNAFLLSETEVFGSKTYSAGNREGTQYEYFKTTINRKKYEGNVTSQGSAYYWYERSPNWNHRNLFCMVDGNGTTYNDYASYAYGLCPAFCL